MGTPAWSNKVAQVCRQPGNSIERTPAVLIIFDIRFDQCYSSAMGVLACRHAAAGAPTPWQTPSYNRDSVGDWRASAPPDGPCACAATPWSLGQWRWFGSHRP